VVVAGAWPCPNAKPLSAVMAVALERNFRRFIAPPQCCGELVVLSRTTDYEARQSASAIIPTIRADLSSLVCASLFI